MSPPGKPSIDPDAQVGPDATVIGDVRLAPGVRIMPGARLVAAGGTIALGRDTIVMENAVLRANAAHSCAIGDNCLIGPCAHIVGATLKEQVFIATGAAVFHGAVIEARAEVRVHGVVHLRSRLEAGRVVPIGWIAVGDPAEIFPPGEHEAIWSRQEPLDFPGFVYGVDRETSDMMVEVTRRLSAALRTD
jgi:carbonic anhydrase/acetyltransferase-like protein (isoleucine patch superfamily)